MLEDQQPQPLAPARVQHHQRIAAATGRNANHDELSRTTAAVMAWSRRPGVPSRTPKQLHMSQYMKINSNQLLTYGKSITNMMKLL
jgi:hypothetical protein